MNIKSLKCLERQLFKNKKYKKYKNWFHSSIWNSQQIWILIKNSKELLYYLIENVY